MPASLYGFHGRREFAGSYRPTPRVAAALGFAAALGWRGETELTTHLRRRFRRPAKRRAANGSLKPVVADQSDRLPSTTFAIRPAAPVLA